MPNIQIVESQPRVGETEKLTINLGGVDLGQIDLLVQEGFYSNRRDLIRSAIRHQIALHSDSLKQTVARRELKLRLQEWNKASLERVGAAGERLQIQVMAWRGSPVTSAPSWPSRRSNPFPSSAPSTPAPRSGVPWPTAFTDSIHLFHSPPQESLHAFHLRLQAALG